MATKKLGSIGWAALIRLEAPVVTVAPTSVALNTAHQISATLASSVTASVEIATGAAGDGTVELMADASNPPTTPRATFRVATALTTITVPLSSNLQPGWYYKLVTTTNAGTPTFTLIGSVMIETTWDV